MSGCLPAASYVLPAGLVFAEAAGCSHIHRELSLSADVSTWASDTLGPEARHWLARNEAGAAVLAGRQVVDLGDGFLVVDPAGPESWRSWAAGLQLPADPDGFDRRLGELIALFGTHDRRPSIRVDPPADAPSDLDRRLHANGFRSSDTSLRMWFPAEALDAVAREADTRRAPANASSTRGDLSIELLGGPANPDIDPADPAIDEAIEVMAAAFGVAPRRGIELRAGVATGMTIGLVRLGGIAVAAGRSAAIDGAAYLSAIGVDPRWRRRGFGRLVTAALSVAAIRRGARVVHLNVDPSNSNAWRMYQSLGFRAASPAVVRFVLRGR